MTEAEGCALLKARFTDAGYSIAENFHFEEGDIEEVHLVLERAEIELVEDDHPFAQAARVAAPEPPSRSRRTSRSRATPRS